MGRLIVPEDIKAQTSSMVQAMNEHNASLNATLPVISEFENDSSLRGISWLGLKTQLSAHRSVLQGMICANESVISDSKIMADCIGAERLDEDEINGQIQVQQNQIDIYQANLSSYRNLLTIITGAISSALALYYFYQISKYTCLINNGNEIIRILEEKLQTIERIDAITKNLYQDAESLYSSVDEGITALEGNWNGANFGVMIPGLWKSTLNEAWKSRSKMYDQLPSEFQQLIDEGHVSIEDFQMTDDGFIVCTKSLADILTSKGITEVEIDGEMVAVSKYYDDWYLYGIQGEDKYTFSLLKMREPENDGGDGDDPGVSISFVEVNFEKLFSFDSPDSFSKEVARVVSDKGETHNDALQKYFAKTESTAGYLIGDLYIDKVLSHSQDGTVGNNNLNNLLDQIQSYEDILNSSTYMEPGEKQAIQKYIEKLKRVPNALTQINEEAGYQIYDPETGTITIKDTNNPTELEKKAILAITTGNVNYNSFVAEIEFHADACEDWKAFAPQWYEAAIHANMGLGEEIESSFYDKYYDLESDIVKAQEDAHGKK